MNWLESISRCCSPLPGEELLTTIDERVTNGPPQRIWWHSRDLFLRASSNQKKDHHTLTCNPARRPANARTLPTHLERRLDSSVRRRFLFAQPANPIQPNRNRNTHSGPHPLPPPPPPPLSPRSFKTGKKGKRKEKEQGREKEQQKTKNKNKNKKLTSSTRPPEHRAVGVLQPFKLSPPPPRATRLHLIIIIIITATANTSTQAPASSTEIFPSSLVVALSYPVARPRASPTTSVRSPPLPLDRLPLPPNPRTCIDS